MTHKRANWNGAWQERTHAFNGRLGKLDSCKRKFCKHEKKNGLELCFLTQVFQRLHPEPLKERHPSFERYGIDCRYLDGDRTKNGRFASGWNNELIIEIENDLKEFVWTLRVLLDIMADHRIAVFFYNSEQTISLDALSDQFRPPWEQCIPITRSPARFTLALCCCPKNSRTRNNSAANRIMLSGVKNLASGNSIGLENSSQNHRFAGPVGRKLR